MFQLKVLFKLENNHLPKEMDRLMPSLTNAAPGRLNEYVYVFIIDLLLSYNALNISLEYRSVAALKKLSISRSISFGKKGCDSCVW